ncbi:hypothetical protein ANANG_G00140200 [Anguilla anguilla]|uniref:AIG1-type G domain-containing protein n=1 Tax=Anguilla anguilla TaxID=7936 RepID=A0A9D3MAL5_ANGAN|nr:hypothetical protein ANANG_G00140200 [Anguilla anguilla]
MLENQERGCGAGRADLRLVLLGGRNSGKSSAGNTILRRSTFAIGKVKSRCTVGTRKVAGKEVTVVDTPGWDYFMAAIPKEIKQETERSVSLCSPGPHAFLLTIPVGSDVRLKRLDEHMLLLGDIVWRYTLVLFTCGDRLAGSTIEEYIVSIGGGLQRLLGKCENRYHVLNNLNMGDETQVTELLEQVRKMRCGIYWTFEPDIQQKHAGEPRQQGTERNKREEQNWSCRNQGGKQNRIEVGQREEQSRNKRDQRGEQNQSERDQVQNTSNCGKVPKSKGTTETSPPPFLNLLIATLTGTLQTMSTREDERRAGTRGAQAEREEPKGRMESVEREKEAHLMPPHMPNKLTLSAPARHTQALQQLGEMAAQLGEVTETLRLMYEEQAREEAERHRDPAPQINAYRVQSAAAAAAQELTAALTERDQERDKLQAEIERLRESTEEKDREMERLRESCVQKDAEIERLKEEVAEVRRRFEETSREVEKNKRVLQQLQALVALVNAPAERE